MSEGRRSLASIARDGWLDRMLEAAPALEPVRTVLGDESLGLLVLARVELLDLREGADASLLVRARFGGAVKEEPLAELIGRVVEELSAQLRVEQTKLRVDEGTGEEMFGPLGCFLAALYGLSLKAFLFGEGGAEIELSVGGELRRIRYSKFYPLLEASLFELGARLAND